MNSWIFRHYLQNYAHRLQSLNWSILHWKVWILTSENTLCSFITMYQTVPTIPTINFPVLSCGLLTSNWRANDERIKNRSLSESIERFVPDAWKWVASTAAGPVTSGQMTRTIGIHTFIYCTKYAYKGKVQVIGTSEYRLWISLLPKNCFALSIREDWGFWSAGATGPVLSFFPMFWPKKKTRKNLALVQ